MLKKLILLAVLFPASSFALIDMQNANYSETWTDILVPNAGYNLKVVRTYNSRTLHNGIFGFGWCSDFETKLKITPDKKIKRIQCGAGSEIPYSPKSYSKGDVKHAVDQIVAAAKKANPKATQAEMLKYRNELMTSAEKREIEADYYGIKAAIKEGVVYYADTENTDKIVFKNGVYTRNTSDKTTQKFDSQGNLIELQDAAGNYLKLNYKNKNIYTIASNTGKKLTFSYTNNGKVKEIRGPKGHKATYSYDNIVNLASAKNENGQVYKYKYDQLHNMVELVYPDKSKKEFKYDTNRDWVTQIKDQNGCYEYYDYKPSKKDPKNHYWSYVVKKCKGKVTSKSRYGFWFKNKKNGTDKYLYRLVTDINGNKTEIIYHSVFGRPIYIKSGKNNTKFAYYSNSFLKSKITNGSKVTYKYDWKYNKVSEIREGKKKTAFKYDKKGNLVFAQNSSGQKVSLNYDRKGRIVKILDQAHREIIITYDDRFNKPKTVKRPGVGTLFVSYDNQGTIKNVRSAKNDPTVAVQVASAFNNLIEIIAPAGINIGI